jgi:hypothetical protein
VKTSNLAGLLLCGKICRSSVSLREEDDKYGRRTGAIKIIIKMNMVIIIKIT